METIYPPKTFICTEKLTYLTEHFQEFANNCCPIGSTLYETYEELFGENFSFDNFEKLSVVCSIDNLTVDKEFEPIEVEKFSKHTKNDLPEVAKNLRTIQTKIVCEKKFGRDRTKDSEQINFLQDFNDSIDFQPGAEIIINVKIHPPFSTHLGEESQRNYRFGYFKSCHEIAALGSQSLKELKNKIICDNYNESIKEAEDIYENIKDDVTTENGSSLICIDDKLYVDIPTTDSIDYSIVVKKWNDDNKLNLNFSTENMNVKLRDLNLRLGYPYLYQHNGNCEHVFVFSDVQLAKKCHSLCIEDYPYYKSISRYILKCCNICKKIPSKWLCTDNNRLIHNVTYFCQDCLISYNYKDGEKIGNFKLYHQRKLLIQQ